MDEERIAIVYRAEAATTVDGSYRWPADRWFVVVHEEDPSALIEYTSLSYHATAKMKAAPRHIALFDFEDQAHAFMQRWSGHPWYCKPSGEYKLVRVEPIKRAAIDGYKEVQFVKPSLRSVRTHVARTSHKCVVCNSYSIHRGHVYVNLALRRPGAPFATLGKWCAAHWNEANDKRKPHEKWMT